MQKQRKDEAIVDEMAYSYCYAPLLSLWETIQRFVNLTQTSAPQKLSSIETLYSVRCTLRSITNCSNSENLNALDDEIRKAIFQLEDVLESHMSSQLLRNSRAIGSDDHTNDDPFGEVEQEILSFSRRITEIVKQSSSSSFNLTPEHVVSCYSSKTSFFADNNSAFVGLDNELKELKLWVAQDRVKSLKVFSILGMAGVGKTALVKAFCEDTDVWPQFDYHLFVPVGPNCPLKEVFLRILAQLNHQKDCNMLGSAHEEKLAEYVSTILRDQRYIILLDDVWNVDVWTGLKGILPDNSNGSRVLLTSRLESVSLDPSIDYCLRKRFLDKGESWDLLCKKVFGIYRCPYKLKKLGEKIAEKCEGLPLAVISVGRHLAEAEKTTEYWQHIAEKGIASIIAADDEVYKVLHPGYEHLTQHLKVLFLYLGVFPQNFVISASKLINLWNAEGFLEHLPYQFLKEFALPYSGNMESDSLVMVKQRRNAVRIKACKLHIVYWCYCKIQASKEKFFQILHTLNDCFAEGVESQRRFCVHNNSLFGIKEAFSSMESVSKARSLLCTGPYHKYPLPFCFGLKFLRVLDAVTIHFYEFPSEVLELVLLKYIAITYNGDLPTSISQLANLWYLIVRRYVTIISPKCLSYLPFEIWNMKELRHLQVVGSDLPEPPCGASLPNLAKLLDVTPRSCTKKVFESLPNLMKLGIQIALPTDDTEPLCSLDYLRELDGLRSLKCVVINPKPSSQVAARAYPTSIFPKGLVMLSLSGFGYSWDQMSAISTLRYLTVLKLRHCAFQGPSWVVRKDEFPKLQFLLLEDIDVRYWNADQQSFINLSQLIIRHCYKLDQMPFQCRGLIMYVLEIVDCQPYLVESSNRLETFIRELNVVFSWVD